MGDSGGRKRSKKSKRSKHKRAKKERVRPAGSPAAADVRPDEPNGDAADDLSDDNKALVIELQRTELSRLLREQQRLNDRIDQLLQLHEREQVLRQQMQASLDKLTAQRALPHPADAHRTHEDMMARVARAEGRFAELQSAVGLLVSFLERRGVVAH